MRNAGGGDQIAQHAEQVLADPFDDLAVDKSLIRRVDQLQSDAPRLLADADIEGGIATHHCSGVIQLTADIQHRQRAGTELLVQATRLRRGQRRHLAARQQAQPPARPYICIHLVQPCGVRLKRRPLLLSGDMKPCAVVVPRAQSNTTTWRTASPRSSTSKASLMSSSFNVCDSKRSTGSNPA